MLDLASTEPQQSGDLIPDGTYAKVIVHLRPGGVDGPSETDRGLLKASVTPGSDVRSLDAELTVLEGPHARRKFWQLLTVAGGKLDQEGQSIGWSMTRRTLRAMIDSALGLDPNDRSEAAAARRRLRGLADLEGITFVAKICVEPSHDPRYPDKNRLERPVLPTEPEWKAVMEGRDVPPRPSRARPAAAPAAAAQPVWAQPASASASTAPAWGNQGAPTSPVTPPSPSPAAKPSGPAWLNG